MTVRRPPRGRGERAGLDREAILDEAIGLSAITAPGALSVRLLAARLGVDPMAIHYWYRGRRALLDAAGSRVLEALGEAPAGEAWEERLLSTATGIRDAVRAHPGLDWPAMSLEEAAGGSGCAERITRAVAAAGLPEREAATMTRAVLHLAAAAGSEAEHDAARFRATVALLVDGLRMRSLDRRVAAGRR